MISSAATFIVQAPARAVWQVLHLSVLGRSALAVILCEDDDTGQGSVRFCEFRMRRYLLPGGMARSRDLPPLFTEH